MYKQTITCIKCGEPFEHFTHTKPKANTKKVCFFCDNHKDKIDARERNKKKAKEKRGKNESVG